MNGIVKVIWQQKDCDIETGHKSRCNHNSQACEAALPTTIIWEAHVSPLKQALNLTLQVATISGIEQEWIQEKGHAYFENCPSLNEKGTEQQGLMNILLELHDGVQYFTKMLRCLWLQANKKSLGLFCSF